MGETRVDLMHLLEDLRDAYPGSLEETILTEIVANSLDSGANAITISVDPAAAALTVADNGRGMTRRELGRYHDLAATSKERGRGIGFAGVGIKLGLLASREVVTETTREGKTFATIWHLKSRNRAPWRRTDPLGLVPAGGTAVRLTLDQPLSPLLDAGFIETTLRTHFAPLFDPAFAEILRAAYPDSIRFAIDGRLLEPEPVATSGSVIAVRLPRRRKLSAFGLLMRDSPAEPGLAVSTFGKVIKRGWDWLGITPRNAERVSGLVEVPDLAECLTLNKADFIRVGPRGARLLAYRKAIQEAVADLLAEWGDAPEAESRRRSARPLERDLEEVLAALSRDYPLVETLVDRRPGGQRRLALDGKPDGARPAELPLLTGLPPGGGESVPPSGEAVPPPEAARGEMNGSGGPPPAVAQARLGHGASKRPAHYGLRIEFESRPDDPALGRLVESTVLVNNAHPAYRRAVASRAEGYHLAVTVGMVLAALAAEPARVHEFVESFLATWGETGDRKRRGSRRSSRS